MAYESLGQKTKMGFIWSAVDSISQKSIQFIIGIILARLLSPDDFGVIGMLAIFMALSNSIIEGGFVNALIQKKDCTQDDYSTVFYINTALGVLLYLILFTAAPYIASFYNMPILTRVTRVEALLLVISSLMLVQTAKLNKELNFKLQTNIRVSCSVFAGVVAIVMAYYGFGVWALVFQSISSNALSCILLWIFSKWKPSLSFSKDSFHSLFSFGSKILVTGLYGPLFDNMNTLIIGKFYTPSMLGSYTKAKNFAEFPSANITGVISRVSFPVLSKLQDDLEALKTAYRKLIRVTYFAVFPMMLGLLVVAKPLVLTLIGEKWSQCIPYLQVLCVSLTLYPLCAYNINALLVKGRSGLHLKLDLTKKVFAVIVLAFTAPFGVIYICWGSVLTSLFSWVLTAYFSGRIIGLPLSTQIKDLTPSFLISIIMAIAVSAFGMLNLPTWSLLSIQIIAGGSIYAALSYLFNKKCWKELLNFVYPGRNV